MSAPSDPTHAVTPWPDTTRPDAHRSGQPHADLERFVAVPDSVEWPTIAVAVGVYGGLLATIAFHQTLGPIGTLAVFSVLGGWFMSLQHESIHGHPFRSRRLTRLLAAAPLCPVLPYEVYRVTHLEHHRNALITQPSIDPESHYLTGDGWVRASAVGRLVLNANQILAGRVVIHPLRSLVRTVAGLPTELRDPAPRRIWLRHLAGTIVVLIAIDRIGGVPAWQFVLGFSYGGGAITAIRGFPEHRWAEPGLTRSATVDAALPWRLLFLNNNFHHAHHAQPTLAWYRLRELSRDLDASSVSARGAGAYRGYGDVFRRFLLRPMAPVVHPEHPARCCAAAPACACAVAAS